MALAEIAIIKSRIFFQIAPRFHSLFFLDPLSVISSRSYSFTLDQTYNTSHAIEILPGILQNTSEFHSFAP